MSRRRLRKSIKKRIDNKVKSKSNRKKFVIDSRWVPWKNKILLALFIVIILILTIFATKYLYKSAKDDWTVMVYMAGDNSLSGIVDQNLDSMKKIGSDENVDVVALTDQSGDQDSKLYHVEKGLLKELPISSIELSGLNEIDTGKPGTLSSFGEYVIKEYPSKHYMLIMWGHGNGWQGLATDKGGSVLTMSEFRTALDDIVEANNGTKLDIIGFDACAMATIEGFYEVSNYADILVASQKKEPDAGWPYKQILNGIVSGKYNSPDAVAKNIVKEYVNAYETGQLPSQDFSVGMTAIRTQKNNELYAAFQRFAAALPSLTDADKNKITGIRDDVESYEDKDNVDLRDLIERISKMDLNDKRIQLDLQDLLSAMNDVIITEEHWNNPNSTIKIDHGDLCIYFPKGAVDPGYKDTAMAQFSQWDEFING
jgi:hypothetical protein